MKATKAHQPLPDHDAELENDAVWSLLEQGTQAEPSPQFTQNTLRAARLQNEKTTTSWWQKIFTPKPIIALGVTGLAAFVITLSLPNQTDTPNDLSSPSNPPSIAEVSEDWDDLEDALASELLSDAAENPSLLTDQQIVALLY